MAEPIACSLDAQVLDARLAEIAALGRDALIASDNQPGRAQLRFRSDGNVHLRLAAVVAAEARCCPFLELQLDDDHTGLLLTIAAPPDAEPLLADLAAAFTVHLASPPT